MRTVLEPGVKRWKRQACNDYIPNVTPDDSHRLSSVWFTLVRLSAACWPIEEEEPLIISIWNHHYVHPLHYMRSSSFRKSLPVSLFASTALAVPAFLLRLSPFKASSTILSPSLFSILLSVALVGQSATKHHLFCNKHPLSSRCCFQMSHTSRWHQILNLIFVCFVLFFFREGWCSST